MQQQEPQVILVDKEDRVIGSAGKLEAHQKNWLHRAFSVVLFRSVGGKFETLLQKRQWSKYHCPGLWSNTCCSHPQPGDSSLSAAVARLAFELHLSFDDIRFVDKFYYQVSFDNQIHEHELDYVFVGFYDQVLPIPNESEVAELGWFSVDDLHLALKERPEDFTPWLKMVMSIACRCLEDGQ